MTIPGASLLGLQSKKLLRGSIFGPLLSIVLGGLVLPAVIAGYVLVGVHEQQAAKTSLNDTLQRNADVLALGLRESMWNLNAQAAQSLVEAVMRDTSVLQVDVIGQSGIAFFSAKGRPRPLGEVYRAERAVMVRGVHIGQVIVAMDDARSSYELHENQSAYIVVLAIQLALSLLLITLFLNRSLIKPMRKLMRFSDRLSQGDFETRLDLGSNDELGRLGAQLERMRLAIKQLFEDVGQREDRFRTIVTQVPGAVFRCQPDGLIDFVSAAIIDISGYSAAQLMRGTTNMWTDLIDPEDRKMQHRAVSVALSDNRSYSVEYRIRDASGAERWVAEQGKAHLSSSGLPWVDGIISDISQRKHHEMRIEALLSEQSAILDNVMFGVMFVRQRTIVSANRRCEELFAYPAGRLTGAPTSILYPTIYESEATSQREHATLSAGEYYSEERQYRRHDGSLFWAQVSGCALDSSRVQDGSIWVYADITARKEAEEKLRLSATVLEHIADGVMVIDAGGIIVAVNPAYTQITGYTEKQALGGDWTLTRAGGDDAAFYQALWADLLASGFWRGERWNVRQNGDLYLEWLTISAVRDSKGVSTHYAGVFSDITLAKQSQEKLDYLAHHDPLTALPNRLMFHDRLLHALQRASRDSEQVALLFIDLDRFKTVNDTLGHHIGDELLQQVARQLSERLREGDTLARLGGDEFIVLLEAVDGQYGAIQVAEKLMTMFEQAFLVADHELFVTCSIGISLYPNDALDVNMLIRNADVAMYQAKARGRNGYRFYAPSMTGEGVERLRLETFLRHAIERDEIFLNYQPQVGIESGRLMGVEALVRWNHPELGLVPPVRFIGLAEDTGFINQLGKWVLFEACRQMVRWQEAGLVVPKIAVNVSVKQFERGSIVNMVTEILRETGLEPQRLQLEVTESVIMNTDDAMVLINDLHAIGVGLAIDDFGTGYSSLAYLKQLPVQTLKIDRSFIKDISSDANDEAIVVAIIQLGKSLNLSVIAEGVETREQAAFLLANGCNLAQGYFFSRPALAEEIVTRWNLPRLTSG